MRECSDQREPSSDHIAPLLDAGAPKSGHLSSAESSSPRTGTGMLINSYVNYPGRNYRKWPCNLSHTLPTSDM